MKTFGERLKYLRKLRGYSQYSLADKLGVPRRLVRYYECEASRPPATLLPELSEALQVSIEELLGTKPIKIDDRTVDSKFWPKWQELKDEEKRTVSKLVDTLLAARAYN